MKPIIRFHTAPIHLRTRDKRTGHLNMMRCPPPMYTQRAIRRAHPFDGATNVVRFGHTLRLRNYAGFRVKMRYQRNAWRNRVRRWRRAP